MPKPNHAPAPWRCDANGFVWDARGRHIATIEGSDADARVIEAAPQLLAILEVLTAHAQEKYPHFESERGRGEIVEALIAIRKAKGGE